MPPEILKKAGEFFKKIPKDYYLPLGIAVFGFLVFGYGLIEFFLSQNIRENNLQPQVFTKNQNLNNQNFDQKQIFVDVEGAVLKPGVYKLGFDSRVKDALIASGGLNENANKNWVAKNLNLALKLTDGAKIYIPLIGEANISEQTNNSGIVSQTEGAIININSGTLTEIDSLPGVGLVTAQKIISNRPYSDISDLLNKKVVSAKVFDGIKSKINVN